MNFVSWHVRSGSGRCGDPFEKVQAGNNLKKHGARSAEQGAQHACCASGCSKGWCGTRVVGRGAWVRRPGRFIAATLANNSKNPVV